MLSRRAHTETIQPTNAFVCRVRKDAGVTELAKRLSMIATFATLDGFAGQKVRRRAAIHILWHTLNFKL